MTVQPSGKGSRLSRLQQRYRLVIMEDETLEMKVSAKLTLLNVYVSVSILLTFLTASIVAVIALTPLKNYLVGYNQVEMTRSLVEQEQILDSLQRVMQQQQLWSANLSRVLRGEIDTAQSRPSTEQSNYNGLDISQVPPEDLALRERITRADYFNLRVAEEENQQRDFRDGIFLSPLEGVITSRFQPAEGHFGIDIAGREKSPVKAIRDGRVIDAYWDEETGNVIVLLHEFGLVSLYKHNSALLRKVGNFVRAGDAIAIVGNTGELSTGPHLHFEMWHDQIPLNPEDFLTF
jgi:murein DD-endopeptidase MepM/ murein hydrolase activator NlpD